MATSPMTRVLDQLRRAALARDEAGLSDGQLLECFVIGREEAAFEALVRRHGPMVLGVCRRVAGNVQDAEDAFQATFLVLVRKAASLRSRELVGNWLYGVAYRTALKARTASARRRIKERQVPDMPDPHVETEDAWLDLLPLLDAALTHLPEKYRVPVVLCELEGRSRKDVAKQLGLPEGTLSSRLATARRMLAQRLKRQGVAFSVPALVALLSHQAASACVPAPLLASTVKAAAPLAAGHAVAGLISARVAALMEGVLKGMLLTKLKMTTAVLFLTACTIGGMGLFAGPAAQLEQQDAKKGSAAQPGTQGKEKSATDQEKIQGTWVVEKAEYGGNEFPQKMTTTITFTGEKVVWLRNTMLREGTFKLDPAKDPRQIDWTLGEFVPRKLAGIYRWEGDKLILSMGSEYEDRRPTAFATKEKETHWVYTLKRQVAKAKDEPKGEDAKLKEARLRCSSMLGQIMLAMHDYHEKHRHFPHPSICGKDGKPLLSWRVALLPQLGYGELYQQFKLDEPWDSEHNKKLLAKMPRVYAPLGPAPKDAHATFYQVFVGGGAAFEEKTDITLLDIHDGTVSTIFVVEAWDAVPWTKPGDLPYDPAQELPKVGGMLGDGLFTFVTGDGATHTTKNVVDAKLMNALITRSGGELIDLADLDR